MRVCGGAVDLTEEEHKKLEVDAKKNFRSITGQVKFIVKDYIRRLENGKN